MGNDSLLQFFEYEHLPTHLQAVSKPFGEMAERLVEALPYNQERTTALRKLLEAKDCAVRAVLMRPSQTISYPEQPSHDEASD